MGRIVAAIVGVVLVAAMVAVVAELRANRALALEIAAVQVQAQDRPEAVGAFRSANRDAGELIQLRVRIAQLKARPDGVVDSEMIPRSQWRNVGCATPESAVETALWAWSAKDIDGIAESLYFPDSDRRILTDWFAGLSESVREKFGTPERALAMVMVRDEAGMPTAYQAIDKQDVRDLGAVQVNVWFQQASGKEAQTKMTLVQIPGADGGWRHNFTGGGMTQEQWQKRFFSQIDPDTGEVLPRSK